MKSYFDLNKKLNHIDSLFFGEGTLITNFDSAQLWRYAEAIEKCGLINKLIVSPFAYNSLGEHLDNHCSLHALKRLDLSEFWKIFDSLYTK